MDLATLSRKLEDGCIYSNRFEFFNDCNVIFTNALKYHASRPETQWILPRAKQILELVKKERSRMEDTLISMMSTSAKETVSKKASSTSAAIDSWMKCAYCGVFQEPKEIFVHQKYCKGIHEEANSSNDGKVECNKYCTQRFLPTELSRRTMRCTERNSVTNIKG